jgi:5,10-methylene-tetrahydrofolate dehydrogenase/methenyl tetrahydrofolate cyclohydrolase
MVHLKLFHEKTDADYMEYTRLWAENKDRFIFLQLHLPYNQQINHIINEIKQDTSANKDILFLQFPTTKDMEQNKIITNVLAGKGVSYDNDKENVWLPAEIWIYNLL